MSEPLGFDGIAGEYAHLLPEVDKSLAVDEAGMHLSVHEAIHLIEYFGDGVSADLRASITNQEEELAAQLEPAGSGAKEDALYYRIVQPLSDGSIDISLVHRDEIAHLYRKAMQDELEYAENPDPDLEEDVKAASKAAKERAALYAIKMAKVLSYSEHSDS